MAQVVEPGTTTTPRLPFAKADVLANAGEGVAGHANVQPPLVFADEERRRHGTEYPVALGTVGAQALGGALRERNDTARSVLCMPDVQDGRVEIDIPIIESDGFADPQSGDREQAEQGRIGCTPQTPVRRQPCGCGHDPGDFAVGVDVGPLALLPVRDQALGRNFRAWVNPLKPGREASHDRQPDRPAMRAGRTEPVFPSQEQIRCDPFVFLSIREGDERTQDEAAGCQVGAVATTLDEVLVEEGRERCHRASPCTGHGRARGRRASMS